MSVVPASKKLTEDELDGLAKAANIETAALRAFCEVEGGGIGFSDVTGRMIIRFEETHFKRNHAGDEPHGIWEQKIVNQSTAWSAFFDAIKIDKEAAMLSTSIGLMQVMVENHNRCNFKTAEDMWLFNEVSEVNQVETGIRFIMDDPSLYRALKNKNWSLVAERYNGAGFRAYAVKNNTLPYDKKMANAYIKFSNGIPLHKTTTTVNLRSGSGTKYPIIKVLWPNTTLSVVNQYQDWKSVKVASTGEEGWVFSKYIS